MTHLNVILSYEWYLNGDLVDSDSNEIEIENIPYQLNNGNLKCVSINSIGKGFGDSKLNIQCKDNLI